MTNNISPKYCFFCGEKLVEYEDKWFDENTGEKLKHFRCENLKCTTGCGNVTGHKAKGWWSYTCKFCGSFIGGGIF